MNILSIEEVKGLILDQVNTLLESIEVEEFTLYEEINLEELEEIVERKFDSEKENFHYCTGYIYGVVAASGYNWQELDFEPHTKAIIDELTNF